VITSHQHPHQRAPHRQVLSKDLRTVRELVEDVVAQLGASAGGASLSGAKVGGGGGGGLGGWLRWVGGSAAGCWRFMGLGLGLQLGLE